MSFELFLAKRYLQGSRHVAGAYLTSAIAIGGVAVGVAALIVTLAVMTGFREDIRNKILGVQPHVIVMGSHQGLPAQDWGGLFEDVRETEAWSPFVMGQAMLRQGPGTQGVIVKGIDMDKEPRVTRLHESLLSGEWEDLRQGPDQESPSIFLGKELARTLRVSVGEPVLMNVPSPSINPLMDMPAFYPFVVKGILETGLYDYDSSLTVMTLSVAQSLFQMKDRYSGLGVRLEDPDESLGAVMRLQKGIGSAGWVRSWLMLNKNLFAALRLEKVVMSIVLILITLVAAFTIVSNLLLVTSQKVREIGILRAMGARQGSIQKIFLLKGLLMGGWGTLWGIVVGLILSLILKKYQFIQLPADVYYVETLPVKIVPLDVLSVAAMALVIVLLATLYPARQAARLDALKAIRHL